jgi:hypothetical protein
VNEIKFRVYEAPIGGAAAVHKQDGMPKKELRFVVARVETDTKTGDHQVTPLAFCFRESIANAFKNMIEREGAILDADCKTKEGSVS